MKQAAVQRLQPLLRCNSINAPSTHPFTADSLLRGIASVMTDSKPRQPQERCRCCCLVLQVYDRDADTWTDVPTNVNSVCGGWARLANGQVGLFAGHYATLDVYQVTTAVVEESGFDHNC